VSLDLYVVLDSNDVPAAKDWADAIREAGFDVALDRSFETTTSSGFCPCPDSERGFEYSYGELSPSAMQSLNLSPKQQKQLGKFDAIVGFHYKTGADLEVVKAASAVLARITGGLIIETESGDILDSAKALAWARGAYAPEPSPPARPRPTKKGISAVDVFRYGVALCAVAYLLFFWFRQ